MVSSYSPLLLGERPGVSAGFHFPFSINPFSIMKKLLALDTSTEACSCALFINGDIRDRFQLAPRIHTELILPMAEELLAEAGLTPNQLDGIAFGQGPGSFTGVRIACGIAQGIAFAAEIPVIPISTLATLAQAAYLDDGSDQVLVAMDARMKEVYWGRYVLDETGIMRLQGEEIVCSPTKISIPTEGEWYGVGSGWSVYAEPLLQRLGKVVESYQGDRLPHASAMIPLALVMFREKQFVKASEVLPVYLRNQVVTTV